MSCLDECEAYWNHCDSSVSPSKFNAFSAETEEKIGDLQEQIDNIEVSGVTYSAGANIDITNHIISVTGIDTTHFATKEELATKQDTLVSGENIKTINGTSILGSGNIEIQGSVVVDPSLDSGSTNPVANSAITNAINTISDNTDNKQDKLTEGAFIDIDTNNVISAKIVVLTRNAWESLVDKDPTVLYLIRES